MRFNLEKDIFKIDNYKESICFDSESNNFPGRDFGTKPKIFYQNNNKVIIKIGGHSGWCGRGNFKYYPPYFMIGILNENFFEKYHTIEYTKKYTKQARLKAMELVEQLK